MNFLLNLLFPRRCVSCGKIGNFFCPACLSKISYLEHQFCSVCQKPAISGQTHPGCQKHQVLSGLVSVCYFKSPVKEAIHQLKYRLVSELVEELTGLMYRYIEPRMIKSWQKKKFVMAPVPLHKLRENWRGFNQSALLGKSLAEKLDLKFEEKLLKRVKNTKPQVDLKGEARQENIKDAFLINPKFQAPNSKCQNILLIDDLVTTGATLQNCAKALKHAGTKEVWALTLARA